MKRPPTHAVPRWRLHLQRQSDVLPPRPTSHRPGVGTAARHPQPAHRAGAGTSGPVDPRSGPPLSGPGVRLQPRPPAGRVHPISYRHHAASNNWAKWQLRTLFYNDSISDKRVPILTWVISSKRRDAQAHQAPYRRRHGPPALLIGLQRFYRDAQ
jgi:hypothetical protein